MSMNIHFILKISSQDRIFKWRWDDMPICKEDVDTWWANADQETRQKAFLSVVKRIHQGRNPRQRQF